MDNSQFIKINNLKYSISCRCTSSVGGKTEEEVKKNWKKEVERTCSFHFNKEQLQAILDNCTSNKFVRLSKFYTDEGVFDCFRAEIQEKLDNSIIQDIIHLYNHHMNQKQIALQSVLQNKKEEESKILDFKTSRTNLKVTQAVESIEKEKVKEKSSTTKTTETIYQGKPCKIVYYFDTNLPLGVVGTPIKIEIINENSTQTLSGKDLIEYLGFKSQPKEIVKKNKPLTPLQIPKIENLKFSEYKEKPEIKEEAFLINYFQGNLYIYCKTLEEAELLMYLAKKHEPQHLRFNKDIEPEGNMYYDLKNGRKFSPNDIWEQRENSKYDTYRYDLRCWNIKSFQELPLYKNFKQKRDSFYRKQFLKSDKKIGARFFETLYMNIDIYVNCPTKEDAMNFLAYADYFEIKPFQTGLDFFPIDYKWEELKEKTCYCLKRCMVVSFDEVKDKCIIYPFHKNEEHNKNVLRRQFLKDYTHEKYKTLVECKSRGDEQFLLQLADYVGLRRADGSSYLEEPLWGIKDEVIYDFQKGIATNTLSRGYFRKTTWFESISKKTYFMNEKEFNEKYVGEGTNTEISCTNERSCEYFTELATFHGYRLKDGRGYDEEIAWEKDFEYGFKNLSVRYYLWRGDWNTYHKWYSSIVGKTAKTVESHTELDSEDKRQKEYLQEQKIQNKIQSNNSKENCKYWKHYQEISLDAYREELQFKEWYTAQTHKNGVNKSVVI